MREGGRPVLARLESALRLLEKLRELPVLDLGAHLIGRESNRLRAHEAWGSKVHERLGVEAVSNNYGRRSSSLQDWGQQLLDLLRVEGFELLSDAGRLQAIDAAQSTFAAVLQNILEQEPLQARLKGRSAEAVIRELLEQADEKGKSGDVAQYLVGAKLMLRLEIEMPVHPANRGDRRGRGDMDARLGDFEVEDAIIEVAVGLPDEKHLTQIVDALGDGDKEVWLLTRSSRVKTWQDELKDTDEVDRRRVIVHSVEGFVGQNLSELGGFSVKGRAVQLERLFTIYNDRWVAAVGTPGIQIVALR
ncbi:MAG TPA: DUF4928 family protein [Tepidisphaeraceae bacterium]|jgi:hypothetical protein